MDLSPWLCLSDAEPEYELAQKLLDGGVGLHPREEHHEEIGWFRLVFSQEMDTLKEALHRSIIRQRYLH
jgi:hypothetical protein